MIIDSHQHFWKYNAIKDAWITDDMKKIQKDFLPEHLSSIYQNLNITGCVAVQAEQSEAETEFLLKLAEANGFIKGIVGWVDLCHPNITERLEHFAKNPLFKGVRHILQAEKDDFVLDPQFQFGISQLRTCGLTYDILIHPQQLENTIKMVAKFPENKFVIDHLAKPYIKAGKIDQWKKDIQQIAQFPNVCCKLSGFVTEADLANWKYEDFVAYFDVIFEAFGAYRVLFGSDWPVCLLAAEYETVFDIVKRYVNNFNLDEKQAILGGNASRFYNLN
ncbi:amidohydrolase family protein [Maribacter sp. ACAM166]|uniref:amidohydrolase family protein n=1 Tax=Maribacter sp. ACAM166 TaxID=2508996 RepID=UPI0010FF45C9|nr:amidohydrolase family protein [Maribacter sp. ACAM166]TLP71112.1 amidohydrolase [Maribacter sp. ACAM166]